MKTKKSIVEQLPEFQRLVEVTASPIYGKAQYDEKILPTGRDPLSKALKDTFPDWNIQNITAAVKQIARDTEDFSLVGLAARAGDPIMLAALRESVVLYAHPTRGLFVDPLTLEYIWDVDDEIMMFAQRFVETFNKLFDEQLPNPEPANLAEYWQAHIGIRIVGRCVRLGFDDRYIPNSQYHWAICRNASANVVVQDFWLEEIWTTSRYQDAILKNGRCLDFESLHLALIKES